MGSFANSEEPDEMPHFCGISSGSALFAKPKSIFRERKTIFFLEIIGCDPSLYTMDQIKLYGIVHWFTKSYGKFHIPKVL